MSRTEAFRNWVPADGDTFVTEQDFVFNVFGDEHPTSRVFSFLKYIPSRYKRLFDLRFLERTWKYGSIELFRAERLYTQENYRRFLEAFRKNFPDYVYFCPFRGKEVISSLVDSIKTVYVPRECLNALKKTKKKDDLQKTALDLLELLSVESSIPLEDFGVRGSIGMNMHTPKSDIDFVVYGGRNFRKLEKTVNRLVEDRTMSYVINNRIDAARLYKGRYSGRIFMYNAVRKPEEIYSKYGTHKYSRVKQVKCQCTIADDSEAVFRPAIYKIRSCRPEISALTTSERKIPEQVVSMIGCYRNVAKRGDKVEVSGMLEQVENVETGEEFHQIVVGTGITEDEYVWPL